MEDKEKQKKFHFGLGTKPNKPPTQTPQKNNTGYLTKVRVRVRKTTTLYFFQEIVVGEKSFHVSMVNTVVQ